MGDGREVVGVWGFGDLHPFGDAEVAGGGGGEGEGDDAHGFGGVIHAVAPAHVGGGGELEFAEDSVDPDWAHPAEDDVEEAHEEEHAEQEDAIQDSSDDGQKEAVDDNDSADLEQQDSSSSSSEGDNSGDRRRRYSEYQKEMNAEAAAVMAEDRRKELNRSAQQGSVDPPNNANPNAMLSLRQVIDVGIMVRGLSKAESLQKQEKHVANRVIQFVKSDIFRRIKFINNDAMFQKAFLLVMNHEKVEPHKRVSFQMLYESCFNLALNLRGVCVNKRVGYLRGKQSPSSNNVANYFTVLTNSVSSGEQQQNGRSVHSSGSSTRS